MVPDMQRMSSWWSVLFALVVTSGISVLQAQVTNLAPATNMVPSRPIWSPAPRTNAPLVWDAMSKETRVKLGETNLAFSFTCTNVSAEEVQIHQTQTSCGCTVATLPSYPYRIAPGAEGKLDVRMDIRGKYGMVTKTITVATSFGVQYLTVTARIPDPILEQTTATTAHLQQMKQQEREANAKAAQTDRQLVFKGSCAVCHTTPLIGKTGKELFDNACGICHDAHPRATMVPDLRAGNRPATYDYWAQWVMAGKPNTLMPAFAKPNGGPLTDDQMLSLVDYLVGPFQKTVQASQPALAAPTVTPLTLPPTPANPQPSMQMPRRNPPMTQPTAQSPRPTPPMPPIPPSLPLPGAVHTK
jgi:mono/diheme cytochrome c family protein